MQHFIVDLSGPLFHIWVNFYSDESPCSSLLDDIRAHAEHVTTMHVKGFKPHFWKYNLTASATAAYDLLLVTDADVRFEPLLGWRPDTIEFWMRRTSANALTTLVAGASQHHRGGSHGLSPGGYGSAFTADGVVCAGVTSERSYVVRRDAYAIFNMLLQHLPDKRLVTDTGLEELMCDAMQTEWPDQPGCVILKNVAIVHQDSHQIRTTGADKYYIGKEQEEFNIKFWLRENADAMRSKLRLEEAKQRWENMCWGVFSNESKRLRPKTGSLGTYGLPG